MKYLTATILVILTPAVLFGAVLRCPRYSVSMEGTTSLFGVSYTERMHVYKVGGGSGYNGRWKVNLLEQIIDYPGNIPVEAATDDLHDFGMGIKMHSRCAVMGNTVTCRSTSDTMFMEVKNNRVRMEGTPVWQGSITGNTMNWKFDKSNPNEPALSGTIAEGRKESIELTIIEPKDKARYEYSSVGPVLDFELEAQTEPWQYADSVEWTVPELEGVKRRVHQGTLTGRRLEVIYEDMPEDYRQFGRKKVTATLKVGACTATETREIQFFYPRDAKNNPEGEHYNWFYYWKQTPAARPFGQTVNIKFGGTTFDLCKGPNVVAIFKPGYMHKTIFVCDMTKKLNKDFKIVVPRVHRKDPSTLRIKQYTTHTHIDTFAAMIMHEFTHFKHYHTWWMGKSEAEKRVYDTDKDDIPDRLEEAMGFDKTKYQTYWGDDPDLKDINGDEEFLTYESTYNYVNGTFDECDWGHPGKNWP